MAQTYDTFWQRRYAKNLEERIQREAEIICSGALDINSYKELAGRIRGLRIALEAIDEVNDEIRKAQEGSG